jgi:hypothetical protein
MRHDLIAIAASLLIVCGLILLGLAVHGVLKIRRRYRALSSHKPVGTVVFSHGSNMRVVGSGFGVGGELVEWFGPRMPIDQCSRRNGTSWQLRNGAAYFDGYIYSRRAPAASALAAAMRPHG